MARIPDEDILLEYVPDKDTIGNLALFNELKRRGWDDEKFWRIRERLITRGILERGRGRGGSVRRRIADETLIIPAPNAKPVKQSLEADLYEPLKKVLSSKWIRDGGIEPDQIHFEVTAKQGRKVTGGTWTRPDITAVSVRTFEHLPGKYIDVWTFEVKPIDGLDVTAIYEAAAHGSRATRSYAILQVPAKIDQRVQDTISRCEREAARLRVGLITFEQAGEFSTWETIVESPRVDTAPEFLEEFIGNLSDETRKRLA